MDGSIGSEILSMSISLLPKSVGVLFKRGRGQAAVEPHNKPQPKVTAAAHGLLLVSGAGS